MTLGPAALAAIIPRDVPVEPDAPEARRWLIDELSKPEYRAAQPTWFDKLAQSVKDWFASLFTGGGDGVPAFLPVLAIVIVVALLVIALIVFGAPRLNRRSHAVTAVFGADDTRGTIELRRSAAAALASGDWDLAVVERFRAIARAVADRSIVSVSPGTTADEFARRAASAFPDQREQLAAAATAFDGVRYLDSPAGEAAARSLASLDDALEHARPQHLVGIDQ